MVRRKTAIDDDETEIKQILNDHPDLLEILKAHPRIIFRALDEDPELWRAVKDNILFGEDPEKVLGDEGSARRKKYEGHHRSRTSSGAAQVRHQRDREARAFARKKADELWAAGSNEFSIHMARKIQPMLEDAGLGTYRETTVRDWIKNLQPERLKKGGRPSNK